MAALTTEPVPSARWRAQVEEFLRAKAAQSPVGPAWERRMRWELLRLPTLLRRVVGVPPPRALRGLTERQLVALRARMPWQKPTFAIHFAALRAFLRWGHHPLADRASLWKLPSGQSGRRRWLTREQLARLHRAARGAERLLVGLEGLNGLRRVEVLRLRAGDVLLAERCLRVLGKGRDGGKWRTIPIHPALVAGLGLAVRGRRPEARLFPLSASGADAVLRRAVRRTGFAAEGVRVSHHDLRRTFGRLAYQGGMDLVQIKNLYGHSSVEMTAHYIGADSEAMRQGLDRL